MWKYKLKHDNQICRIQLSEIIRLPPTEILERLIKKTLFLHCVSENIRGLWKRIAKKKKKVAFQNIGETSWLTDEKNYSFPKRSKIVFFAHYLLFLLIYFYPCIEIISEQIKWTFNLISTIWLLSFDKDCRSIWILSKVSHWNENVSFWRNLLFLLA